MSVGLLQSTELKLNAYLGSLVVQGNGGSNTLSANTTLTPQQSGVVFGIDQTAAFNITIPLASAACGVEYTFVVTTAAAQAVEIRGGGAGSLVGFKLITTAGPGVLSVVDNETISFAAVVGNKGARIKLTSNGDKWLVEAYSPVAAGITVT